MRLEAAFRTQHQSRDMALCTPQVPTIGSALGESLERLMISDRNADLWVPCNPSDRTRSRAHFPDCRFFGTVHRVGFFEFHASIRHHKKLSRCSPAADPLDVERSCETACVGFEVRPCVPLVRFISDDQ